ncbi:pyridoxal-phosphate dependent enzyme [Pricia sp. S334]|uniref:Pyridoxal-phosphate dependent enzyme n=1 Tax=Pricia mediterranea TaxID=3076079 RepID=A0ABU3L480_9FLAO|nr:pyridoxal-phosphate dependent enzyme [Pricia sp. S334]MDT7828193.1 pyridoxal-phosphate dependent enzyme [Pricia sp. S334]
MGKFRNTDSIHAPTLEEKGKVRNQAVTLPILSEKQVSLTIKREDLIHPLISGNKFRKLKYNLIESHRKGFDTVLTFGGAFSNHIAATAYAGKLQGLKTVGIIRGHELAEKWESNPTLRSASDQGMQLEFVSREAYRDKENPSYLKYLQHRFGPCYLLPEGGTNPLAVKGCEEILTPSDADFDVICCPVGTGGTLAGIINASLENQQILGFPALNGGFLSEDIRNFARKENWELVDDYHFGGYAKVTGELVHFINDFKKRTCIPLDPIYTGKMVLGIFELIKKDYFPPKTRILVVHTGGLQGISGMNIHLKKKNLPALDL